MNKKEPQGKIELHLGGCKQNNQTPEVPNELYTEWKDWASNRFNNSCRSWYRKPDALCLYLLHTLKDIKFTDIEEQGFMPVYERQEITDDLHETCGFRTDYQFITKRKMKGIQKKVSGDKTLLYFVYADKSATPLVFTGIVALF